MDAGVSILLIKRRFGHVRRFSTVTGEGSNRDGVGIHIGSADGQSLGGFLDLGWYLTKKSSIINKLNI